MDLRFGADGLITAVIQDRLGGQVRMVGHMNREALAATLLIEASSVQTRLDNVHYAKTNGTIVPGARIAHTGPIGKHGTYALIAATAYAVARLLRRKQKNKP